MLWYFYIYIRYHLKWLQTIIWSEWILLWNRKKGLRNCYYNGNDDHRATDDDCGPNHYNFSVSQWQGPGTCICFLDWYFFWLILHDTFIQWHITNMTHYCSVVCFFNSQFRWHDELSMYRNYFIKIWSDMMYVMVYWDAPPGALAVASALHTDK